MTLFDSNQAEASNFDQLWYNNDEPVEYFPPKHSDQGISREFECDTESSTARGIRVAAKSDRDRLPEFLNGVDPNAASSKSIELFKDPNGYFAKMARNGSELVQSRRIEKERAESVKEKLGIKSASSRQARKALSVVDRSSQRETILAKRAELPAYKDKPLLLQMIRSNQVVIIVGETGSGKTTQLPQILYEAGFAKSGMIGCTQPRRIAATSVAHRVAVEVGCAIGDEVGYSIRFENKTSEKTHIKFMTDGILLRELMEDPLLDKYSCIIIDEAHERSLNSDLLMGAVKTVLAQRLDFRLLITSASINADKFSCFYGQAPVHKIGGRLFPVDIHNLRTNPDDYVAAAAKQVMSIHLQQPPGDVLVFMTGQQDVEATVEEISRKMNLLEDCAPILLLPLYSQLPSEMQEQIFEPPPTGVRKVVVSTNIAETSLTIEGIKYVVDTGLCKMKVFKPQFSMEVLQVAPISKAAALQRAGRAGRTSRGSTYRLYTKFSEDNELYDNNIPEIQRTNLTNTVLLLKSLGIGDVLTFDFIDSPNLFCLHQSLYDLWVLEALDKAGELTSLGQDLSKLPTDPAMSRLIIAGVEEDCIEEVTTIAAMLSVPPVFIPKRHATNNKSLLEKYQNAESDHLTLLNIFKSWRSNMGQRDWAKENHLNERSLIAASSVKSQFKDLLRLKFGKYGKPQPLNEIKVQFCLAKAYFFQAARRTGLRSFINLVHNLPMQLHPTSALRLSSQLPDYVVYHELIYTSQQFMSVATAVRPEWLVACGSAIYYDLNDLDAAPGNSDSKKTEPVPKRHTIGQSPAKDKAKKKARLGLLKRGV